MSKKAATARTRRTADKESAIENDTPANRSSFERMAAAVADSRAAERRAMIADAAYFRAERRGFEPGHELQDWLAAEIEVTNVQQREAGAAFQD